ncbi:TonB-dependent receptor [Flavobacterium collinsii]|uniref:TonB-dependent receptor n=1 Tax=Flavobacterium collinsii TaxID=1114861 RepID=UPI0022BE0DC4|nr:TonB-dependent receptor [Flavobacterium collinsii]GIQ58128.1 TonB-dependent receptor [Flavobacterium collinsii]
MSFVKNKQNPLYYKILQLSFLVVFFISNQIIAQENASIKGKVTSADGVNSEHINVTLSGLNLSVETNQDGNYEFKNVPFGNYTLTFSFLGLESQELIVKVALTNQVLPNIFMKESNSQLREVVVSAQRQNQFAQKKTQFVSRLPLSNINTPQSYTVVTKELLKEQLVTDFPTAMKSITGGGYVQTNDGNVSAYLRGFRSDGYLRDGMVSYVRAPIDPQNFERIEVIKGPSAVFFGSSFNNISNYGGVVNRVVKRPFNGQKAELSYTTGSWNLNRLTADYNTTLNDDGTALFRINGAYHSEQSFQPEVFQKNYLIAPSFSYQVNDRLSILVDAELYKTDRNLFFARGVSPALIAKNNSWDDLKWDFNTSYHSRNMAAKMFSRTFRALIDYKITDHWSSKTGYTSSSIDTDGKYIRLVMMTDKMLQRNFIEYHPREAGSNQIQQDFTGIHTFGKFENKVVVGGTYTTMYDDYQRALYRGPFIEYDQIDVTTGAVPPMTEEAWDDKLKTVNASVANTQTETNNLGIYLSDAITFNKKFTFLGGLRFDRNFQKSIKTNGVVTSPWFNQNTMAWKAGFVYAPVVDQFSVFANIQNGFSNIAPALGKTGIENFDPEEANQWEIGTKLNFIEGKLVATVSYYQIAIKNGLRNVIEGANTYSIQDAEKSSKGFEAEIIANPFQGFNVVAGYTKNSAKFVKASNAAIIGNNLDYSPEEMANFWMSYRVLKGKIEGLGVGFGGNYVSKIFMNDTNTFSSNGYTVFDGLLFYDQPKYRLSMKIDNLFDKEYYNGYGQPQKPLTFLFGVNFKI